MQRSILIICGVLLLLASAACVSSPDLKGDRDYDILSEPGGKVLAMEAILVETVRAADLPAAPTDAAGVFVRREGNSVFIGTGSVTVSLAPVSGDSSWPEAGYDGDLVEVFTTPNTRIFQDDTLQRLGSGVPSEPIDQLLKPGSLVEIGRASMISAWGEKSGERLEADVLVYANQLFLDKGKGE
jgi:hypothetical protein